MFLIQTLQARELLKKNKKTIAIFSLRKRKENYVESRYVFAQFAHADLKSTKYRPKIKHQEQCAAKPVIYPKIRKNVNFPPTFKTSSPLDLFNKSDLNQLINGHTQLCRLATCILPHPHVDIQENPSENVPRLA